MADNFQTTPPSGSPTHTWRSDEVGGVHYPINKLAFGPDGTANEVDDAAGKRIPVKVAEGLAASAIVSGQVAVGTTEAPLPTQAVKRVTIRALVNNNNLCHIGPAGLTTSTGYILYPGDSVTLEVANLNVISCIAPAASQFLTYIGEV